jgi:hypothetical protein
MRNTMIEADQTGRVHETAGVPPDRADAPRIALSLRFPRSALKAPEIPGGQLQGMTALFRGAKKEPMSTKAHSHSTVKLGTVVVVAFDWAAQCSADPREIPFLATKAVTYLLRHFQKISSSGPAPVLLPPGDNQELLALETAGRPFGVSASTNE